jgi:hypothetical protein
VANEQTLISVEPSVNIYFPHQLVLCPKTEKLTTEEERVPMNYLDSGLWQAIDQIGRCTSMLVILVIKGQ